MNADLFSNSRCVSWGASLKQKQIQEKAELLGVTQSQHTPVCWAWMPQTHNVFARNMSCCCTEKVAVLRKREEVSPSSSSASAVGGRLRHRWTESWCGCSLWVHSESLRPVWKHWAGQPQHQPDYSTYVHTRAHTHTEHWQLLGNQ